MTLLSRLFTSLLLIYFSIMLSSCGTLPAFDPHANESRTVASTSNLSKTVAVPDGMVWYTSQTKSAGLRFPPGAYALEAEDTDYWYFRSATPLEFRSFSGGQTTDSHTSPGGLALGKRSLRLVPAAGYIDGGDSTKVLVWKLGGDFLSMEGKQWRKSF